MKTLSLIFVSTLLLSACSKTVKEITNSTTEEKVDKLKQEKQQKLNKDLAAMRGLLSSEAPNLALAEILVKSLSKEYSAEVNTLVSQLSIEEAQAIIKQIQLDNRRTHNFFLFHGQRYQDNEALLSHSLMNPDSFLGHPFSVENQLKVSTFAYLKNKALDDIISTYDRRANELAIQLAESIAFEIGNGHPQDAARIEKAVNSSSQERAIELIKKAKPVLEKIDKYFKHSELSENEQYTVVMTGIIAGAIYMKVKENENFKRIVEKGQRIIRDIKEFEKKAKEFVVLINALEGHIENSERDIRNLKDGLKGSREDLQDLYTTAIGINGPKDLGSKRIIDFLYKKVISGEKTKNDEVNESILSKQVSFNENFKKTLTAAGNLSNNLSNIINTTNRLTALFGMKPSKDLQNVLDKAQKVSAVIGTVQSAVAGFATGGFLGAIGAISSGPMGALMAGGESSTSAQLSEISKKLDQVLRNQREMMKMQIETMNMIKDLALMVDVYHQREMAALSSLRDYSLVELEIARASQNKDIRSCERIINFQLSSVWKNMNFGRDSFNSINNIDLLSARFNSEIHNLKDIQRILISIESNGYANCQKALAEAFGGTHPEESPLRLIYNTNEDVNFYKFQRDIYHPLVSALRKFSGSSSFDSLPLHLPMKTYKSLKIKSHYIDNPDRSMNENQIYELEQLFSVKNLERYLNHLIVLLPILDLDKDVWLTGYSEIIETYLRNANISRNQNTRSYFLLKNALHITQSAIAQEAILSGEPLLPKLYESFIDVIFSTKDCSPKNRDDAFICSLRSNKLLLKNLLSYTLIKDGEGINDFLERYTAAYEKKNAQEISKLLNFADQALKVSILSDSLVLTLNGDKKEEVILNLPEPESLKDGLIIYSENMPRLLKMQEVIINSLEKVMPIKRDHEGNDLLKVLMIGA